MCSFNSSVIIFISNKIRCYSIFNFMNKIAYPFFFLKYKYISRYIFGIILCLISVLFLYIGVNHTSLIFLYIGSSIMGFGTIFLYLTYMVFLKHFPTQYLSSYIIGDLGGGILITLIYFLFEKLNFPFRYVKIIFII